jgi:flagellar biosynthesis protein FlhF
VLEVFVGTHLPAVLREVRAALGDHACVVDVTHRDGQVQVLASPVAVTARTLRDPASETAPDPSVFGAAPPPVMPAPAVAARPLTVLPASRDRRRPPIVALVGPTGVGKTTTLAKLATHPEAFGGRAVGILGMDTYRVGAVEQLETYAELADVPCEIVYAEADLPRAIGRLVDREVILVDTPGRGPRQIEDLGTIRRWLRQLDAEEVHLVLPASAMPLALRHTIAMFRSFGVTHALATKLDECPRDARVFDVASEASLPMHWYTEGQEVPRDLRRAGARMAQAAALRAARRRAQEVFA